MQLVHVKTKYYAYVIYDDNFISRGPSDRREEKVNVIIREVPPKKYVHLKYHLYKKKHVNNCS